MSGDLQVAGLPPQGQKHTVCARPCCVMRSGRTMVAWEHAVLVRRLRLAALAGVSLTALSCAAAAQDGGETSLSLPADGRISIVPVAADRVSLPFDADAARFHVSIPPGPLEPALTALAKQMQLKLAYQTTLTETLINPGRGRRIPTTGGTCQNSHRHRLDLPLRWSFHYHACQSSLRSIGRAWIGCIGAAG